MSRSTLIAILLTMNGGIAYAARPASQVIAVTVAASRELLSLQYREQNRTAQLRAEIETAERGLYALMYDRKRPDRLKARKAELAVLEQRLKSAKRDGFKSDEQVEEIEKDIEDLKLKIKLASIRNEEMAKAGIDHFQKQLAKQTPQLERLTGKFDAERDELLEVIKSYSKAFQDLMESHVRKPRGGAPIRVLRHELQDYPAGLVTTWVDRKGNLAMESKIFYSGIKQSVSKKGSHQAIGSHLVSADSSDLFVVRPGKFIVTFTVKDRDALQGQSLRVLAQKYVDLNRLAKLSGPNATKPERDWYGVRD